MFSKKIFFHKKSTDLKIFFWFFAIFWSNFRKLKLSKEIWKSWFSAKNRKYFFVVGRFFLKKKLKKSFYFLKENRLNFNRLLVRNSRAQSDKNGEQKTEKSLPKLPFPRLVGESFIRPFFTKNRLTRWQNCSISKTIWSWASLRFSEVREGHVS